MEAPIIIVEPESRLDVLVGVDVNFSVTATGDSLRYQWQKDGDNITDSPGTYSGANSKSLVVQNVSEINEGSYQVIITNQAGAITSAQINLTICELFNISNCNN